MASPDQDATPREHPTSPSVSSQAEHKTQAQVLELRTVFVSFVKASSTLMDGGDTKDKPKVLKQKEKLDKILGRQGPLISPAHSTV